MTSASPRHNGAQEAAHLSTTIPGLVPVSKSTDSFAFDMADLVAELPSVDDGQISLADLLSRVVQAIYAEMTEFAETMPQMSDAARKRTLADFCVRTKKQVAKLYAVTKWSRDAEIVQKCMNITAFLMDHNKQLLDSVDRLQWTKEILAPAQIRNHDLLTSIDVLTTGTYRRLPTTVKRQILATLTVDVPQISFLLRDMEATIRFRLRASEPLPVEMSNYIIWDGRVTFVATHLFNTTLSLRGAQENDRWVFLQVEFLFGIGGGVTSLQDFPRRPSGVVKAFIEDEANARLGYYIDEPSAAQQPNLPTEMIDAPLIRLYNFLQMMSLSYQLETLHYQASRLRALGWGEFLQVEMAMTRKSFKTSYWIRRQQGRYQGIASQPPLPSTGGVLEISLRQLDYSKRIESGGTTPVGRIFSDLDRESKAEAGRQFSDSIERFEMDVSWSPVQGALGVSANVQVNARDLRMNPDCIDFEAMLLKIIRWHCRAILSVIREQLLQQVFSRREDVILLDSDEGSSLNVHITCEEVVNISIDPRTGRFSLQDTGDLSATVRGPRFSAVADRINEYPTLLTEAISRFRYTRILDAAEQKASYLGFRSFRLRNLKPDELMKFGPRAKSFLFIQLTLFPSHYLVLVISEDGYKFALIAIRQLDEGPNAMSVMDDIGWLEIDRITDTSGMAIHQTNILAPRLPIGLSGGDDRYLQTTSTGFDLSSKLLRELYTYCCARVSHLKVEQQLKESGYMYSHVLVSRHPLHYSTSNRHRYPSVTNAIPALCVKSLDILAGAEAADAVDENVRVMPLSWWGSGKTQVLTCVKLKHVQSTLGKMGRTNARIIRSSKTITYDTQEGIISILSPSIPGCVLHFLTEWSKVSKMVVMAREVYKMSQEASWRGVALLSFDLQTLEFIYATGFAIGVTCQNEATSSPAYTLTFFRPPETSRDIDASIASTPNSDGFVLSDTDLNPHAEMSSWALQVLSTSDIASNIRQLVGLLRTSLPIVLELELQRLKLTSLFEKPHWCPKGVRWWRFIFSDLRHALDFRIRKDSLLEILDGGRSQVTLAPLLVIGQNPRGFIPIKNFSSMCKQIARNSPVPVLNADAGLLFSCRSPQQASRDLVGMFIETVQQSLQHAEVELPLNI